MKGISRTVLMAAAGVGIAIVAFWLVALWLPRQRAYDSASAAARAAQQQAVQLQSQLDRLRSEQQRLPQMQAQLAKMQTAIPDTPQLAQILLSINDAASKAGVTLTSIAPSPPTAASAGAPGSPPDVHISLSLSGGYFQVLDFIDRLDTLPRLVVLDSINLASGGSATAQELSVTMTARMFTTQAPASAATTTTTVPGATATTTPGGASTTTTRPAVP